MKTKYLAFAAAAFMLASCSNDEDFVPQDNLKDKPITVTAGVAELTTRAGYEGTSVLPETFYLSITQDTEDATSKYNYTNLLMTRGADNTYTAPASANLLWKDSNRDVAVNAYTTDGTTFTVQTDQSTTDGVLASDLLGAIKTPPCFPFGQAHFWFSNLCQGTNHPALAKPTANGQGIPCHCNWRAP